VNPDESRPAKPMLKSRPLVEPLTAFFPAKECQDQALERMRQSRER
jgi:hypothetical protein